MVKGTQIGTVTNAQGNFKLNVEDDNAVLVIQHLLVSNHRKFLS